MAEAFNIEFPVSINAALNGMLTQEVSIICPLYYIMDRDGEINSRRMFNLIHSYYRRTDGPSLEHFFELNILEQTGDKGNYTMMQFIYCEETHPGRKRHTSATRFPSLYQEWRTWADKTLKSPVDHRLMIPLYDIPNLYLNLFGDYITYSRNWDRAMKGSQEGQDSTKDFDFGAEVEENWSAQMGGN
jgi:hypothetical protein